MKRYLILISVPVLLLSAGCNQKKIERLQAQQDSLIAVSSEKESALDEFVTAFNEIQANLDSIKRLEQVIDKSAKSGEVKGSRKEQIQSDIAYIYQLQVKNRKQLAALTARLKKTDKHSAEMEKLIENLQKTISEKEARIATLTDELGKMNLQVQDLSFKLSGLNSKADSLSADAQRKSSIIEQETAALHTAYYVMGSSKELKEKKIIAASGGFLGIGRTRSMIPDVDMNRFTRVDITESTEIPIMKKKVTLVTPHPGSSYKIEGDDMADKLVILDPDRFWSQSKTLVMVTR